MSTDYKGDTAAALDTKRFVFLVEDEPGTTMEIVEQLERRGVEVIIKARISEAETLVSEKRFDLILIDLRIAHGKHDLHRGGEGFAMDLANGTFGPKNARTPFVILTAFPYEANRDGLNELDSYCGVIDKTASSLATLAASTAKLCPWLARIAFVDANPPNIMVDLLIVEEPTSFDEIVHFTVPSWSTSEKVAIKLDKLPEELQQELAYGYRPVFVHAKVNVRASRAEFVRPHDFQILETVEDHSAFDWMEP